MFICPRQQKKLLQFLKDLEQSPSPPITPTTSHLHTTSSKLHSHSVDLVTSKLEDKSIVTKKRSPSSAGTQRRTSFDWLNDNSSKIQRSQSVSKLSNVIGVEENKRPPSRLPSGRTSGLRGLLQSCGHYLEDFNTDTLQAKRCGGKIMIVIM